MSSSPVKPDYSIPTLADEGFSKPLDESIRFGTNRTVHFEPEWRQSGSLPDQPVGLEVDAAPGNARPARFR